MPRRRDLPCAACGELMWRGKGVLPAGQAMCRPCRAAGRKPSSEYGGREIPAPRVREHGAARYHAGCRCETCRAGVAAEARSYRRRRREQGRPIKRGTPWRPAKAKPCEFCGAPFDAEPKQRFCSLACSQRNRYGWSTSRELVVVPKPVAVRSTVAPTLIVTGRRFWSAITSGPCAKCGEQFTSLSGSARFCSPRCAGLTARRRAKFKVPMRVRLGIYSRDNWTCQLCREPVDPTADPTSDWYPSLDHIVPQSHTLIPDHSEANLRTAHRWCNAVRGAHGKHDDFFEEVA